MKTTIEILKEARELIAQDGKWTQFAFARNASGHDTADPTGEEAACFCAWGALIRQGLGGPMGAAHNALERAMAGNIPRYNDAVGRTQAEVVAKFDEAIAAEEAKVSA